MLGQQDFGTLTDYTNYLCKMALELESLSQGHIRWYTHKNPYGCWICDLNMLLKRWEDLYYPKSVKIVKSHTRFILTKTELLVKHIEVFRLELARVSHMEQELALQLVELSSILKKKRLEVT